jgi:hypothetical protein
LAATALLYSLPLAGSRAYPRRIVRELHDVIAHSVSVSTTAGILGKPTQASS